MSAVVGEVRSGSYHDSIVLMQLRVRLMDEPGVEDAGVVMATEANLEILGASALLPSPLPEVRPDDLLVTVRAEDEAAAREALGRIDALLARRASGAGSGEYRPRGMEGAVSAAPDARWVLISVPGRHAAKVARQALEAGRNVFLYSDNVSLEDEVELKRQAARSGLLVLGPDCGTAMIGGASFGFANRLENGPVGIVSASGTGLQAVACRLDDRGVGISQAIGTGGRDLSRQVGAAAAHQALAWLGADPATRVIALVGKPPAPEVLPELLAAAQHTGKPVVLHFQGAPPPPGPLGRLCFAPGLTAAGDLAADLAATELGSVAEPAPALEGWVRGLFAGGTLAGEMAAALAWFLAPLSANVSAFGVSGADGGEGVGHSILDLGDDAFTVGRLHPMIDPALRLERLAREASDPAVGTLIFDVVLGDGAEADPAIGLAPVVEAAVAGGKEVMALVVGSAGDPQDLARQREILGEAGARLFEDTGALASVLFERYAASVAPRPLPPVPAEALRPPEEVINFGLESFGESLVAGSEPARVVQADWRPPAGGDEALMALLEKMGR